MVAVLARQPSYRRSVCTQNIDRMLMHKDEVAHEYGVSRAPLNQLVWGTRNIGDRNGNANKLCIGEVPVTFWLPGELQAINFYEKGSDEKLRWRPSVSVLACRQNDYDIVEQRVDSRNNLPGGFELFCILWVC